MKRRDILRYTALATGTAVVAPLSSAILSGCSTKGVETQAASDAVNFSSGQFTLARDMMDVILPRTDSPSATDVGVDTTIDQIIGKTYPAEEKEAFLEGFADLTQWFDSNGYVDLGAGEKKEFLINVESGMTDASEEVKLIYLHFKQLVIAFYLSSEDVAENHLNYLPVPGQYEPCIQLSDVGGKKWAI